jgi:hypothetical protein
MRFKYKPNHDSGHTPAAKRCKNAAHSLPELAERAQAVG